MSRLIRRFYVLHSVYFARMLEYRAEVFLWALANLMPFIMMGLWVSASSGAEYALTSMEFARYFAAMFLVRQMTIVWVIWDFEDHVVEGRLSPYLLQPMDPVWRFLATHVAERSTRLPFTIVMLALFFVLYPVAFWLPALRDAVLGVIAIILAFLMRFTMQYTLALVSFWVERASAFDALQFVLYTFLSGLIAPLDVFPPAVRAVAEWTPFPYLIYFPSKLLIESSSPSINVPRGFAIILGWLIIITVINRVLWRLGLKRYSAMGA